MPNKSLLLLILMSFAVLAEDQESENPDAAVEETAEEPVDVEIEDIDVNTDHTEEDDGVFIPTDEVSYQQSVPFPTDI